MRALVQADPRLDFKKTVVLGAMQRLYPHKVATSEWAAAMKASADVKRSKGKALFNTIKHYKVAYARKTPAQWAISILENSDKNGVDDDNDPGDGSKGGDKEDDESDNGTSMGDGGTTSPDIPAAQSGPASPRAAQELYFCGWDAKQKELHRRAWRQFADGSGDKEFSVELLPGASDMECITAKFADGSIHKIAKIMTATLAAMEESNGKKVEQEKEKAARSCIFFSGKMQDGAPVVVKQRRDGFDNQGAQKRLCSLYVFKHQKCMLRLGGAVSDETAIKVMTKLAEGLVDGSIAVDRLFDERNKMMKAMNACIPVKGKAKNSAKKAPKEKDATEGEGPPLPVLTADEPAMPAIPPMGKKPRLAMPAIPTSLFAGM